MVGEREALTRDQERVLQAVYDRFRESGAWPRFGEIDRQMDRGPRRTDAGQVVLGIPSTLLQPLGSSPAASMEYPLRLTLEGVARCKGSEDDVSSFLRALRWMARQERRFVPGTSPKTSAATADTQQVMRALKIPKTRAGDVQRLGAILMVERWGWSGGGYRPDGTWNFTLTRDVRRFGNVQSLDHYRAVHRSWAKETQPRMQANVTPDQAEREELPTLVLATNGDYVDRAVVADIEAKQARSKWRCAKLLQLIRELNDAHARQNPHAAHALLRAIVDHVPPLFGYKDFAEVVNNYGWSGTDRSYMRRLFDTKKQGDEALHRQISKKPGTQLSMEDLPNRRPVNRLLEECVTLLWRLHGPVPLEVVRERWTCRRSRTSRPRRTPYSKMVTSSASHDNDKRLEYHVSISHAWEDKEDFVRSLATALEARNLRPWYDEFTLRPGESLASQY